MNNSLTKQTQKPKFSVVLQSNAMKNLINNTLGDPKRASNFIASISSAVAVNPALQDCDPFTIVTGALVGESLGLSPSPQLGHYFLVPFNDKERGKLAVFQMGYKGYIQLAMRSGQYKKLNVLAIKDGELVKYDPLNEEIEVNLIEDDSIREEKDTIGYFAMFEYLNGFRKTMYWSKKKMKAHAIKYSQGYKKDIEKGWNYTFWSKDFDGMAYKTMLRQLISKWGIMSIEMQKAFESDMGVIHENNKVEYVDNDGSIEPTTPLDTNNNVVVEEETVEEPKQEAPQPAVNQAPQPNTRNIKAKSQPAYEEEAVVVEEYEQDNLFEPRKFNGEF
jgi:recombination protein RecT